MKGGLTFLNYTNIVPTKLRKQHLDALHFGHAGTTKMTAEAKIIWWPNINRDIEEKVKNCIACPASGENLMYQIPKNERGKLKTLTEPGQENQINFTGNLHNRKLNAKKTNITLNAVDSVSDRSTVNFCKISETKELINFLRQNFNPYGIPRNTAKTYLG